MNKTRTGEGGKPLPIHSRMHGIDAHTLHERGSNGIPPVPRKEVFQPHLPVRLPCYDLAPITGVTLGRACNGYGLQAPPAFMA